MWNRKDLKKQGKAAVKRNYWKAVLVSGITTALAGGAGAACSASAESQETQSSIENSISGLSPKMLAGMFAMVTVIALIVMVCIVAAKILIVNPLEAGIHKFQINAVNDVGNISDLGNGYDYAYKRNVKALFLRDLYIFLWTLLFIIPGIIKSYEYRMVPYLLADHPDMDVKEVFAESKAMMSGNKWRAFVLDISFILWDILGCMTVGIVAFLYVLPYRNLTGAALYEALKENDR